MISAGNSRVLITFASVGAQQAVFLLAIADAVTQTWYDAYLTWHKYFYGIEVLKQEGPVSLNDLVKNKTASIDVQFGTIKFIRENQTPFVTIAVDVTFADSSSELDSENKIQMDLKFPADPESEPVLAIVEKARRQVIDRLRSAANILDGKSSAALLFGEDD